MRRQYPNETWDIIAGHVTRETSIPVTKDMVRNRYARATSTTGDLPDEGDTVEAMRRVLTDTRTELQNIRAKRSELADTFYSAIGQAIQGMDIPPVVAPDARDYDGIPGHAVMVGADWQMGKLINGDYDTGVAMARVGEWVEESLARIIANPFRVGTAHLLLLGDLLENETVFPTQASRIDSSLYRQVFDVAQTLITIIRRILTVVDYLEVEGVGGNHGYNQKNSSPETNFDCMAMNTARMVLAGEPRLSFPEPFVRGEAKWSMMHQVGPHVFFGFHGNQIRSRPHTEAFRNRLLGYRATEGEFDFALTGHYHTSINQDLGAFEHFGAGSTESGNTYAREWLATGAQKGSQWTLILDDQGIYARHLVKLT